jgi:hypothetical protein
MKIGHVYHIKCGNWESDSFKHLGDVDLLAVYLDLVPLGSWYPENRFHIEILASNPATGCGQDYLLAYVLIYIILSK